MILSFPSKYVFALWLHTTSISLCRLESLAIVSYFLTSGLRFRLEVFPAIARRYHYLVAIDKNPFGLVSGVVDFGPPARLGFSRGLCGSPSQRFNRDRLASIASESNSSTNDPRSDLKVGRRLFNLSRVESFALVANLVDA